MNAATLKMLEGKLTALVEQQGAQHQVFSGSSWSSCGCAPTTPPADALEGDVSPSIELLLRGREQIRQKVENMIKGWRISRNCSQNDPAAVGRKQSGKVNHHE